MTKENQAAKESWATKKSQNAEESQAAKEDWAGPKPQLDQKQAREEYY